AGAEGGVESWAGGRGCRRCRTAQEAVLSLSRPVAPSADGTGGQAGWNPLEPPQGRKAGAAPVEDVLRMQLVGANAAPRVRGVDPLPGTSNYFLGNDPAQWRTNVARYGEVAYQDVYPGIDLVYYGNQRQLEYDFTVAPGATAGEIRLAFAGAVGLAINGQGELVVHTAGGDLVEHAPVLYQEVGGSRQA